MHLPLARITNIKENKLSEYFYGRVHIEAATSLLLFHKGGSAQNLVHSLKYNGKKEIGHFLGNLMGKELIDSVHFSVIDVIVPVPLHKRKQQKRGFNQSGIFGEGISATTGLPICTNGLLRVIPTETQTRRSRFSRWKNVESVFHIPNQQLFENKNILLVDDVVTTGATLEACAAKLLECKGAKVWIATIALAS